MKTIVAIILSTSVLMHAQILNKTIDELVEEDMKVEKLKVPVYDPFRRATPLLKRKGEKGPYVKRRRTELTAIFNDKAFINGKWYHEGESLSDGKIIQVKAERVLLKQGSKTKVLLLNKKKKLIKTSIKGEE